MTQTNQINTLGKYIGPRTENGIWLFFDNAIKTCEHWDNIFIYSDQQAGHGELFGIDGENNYHDYIMPKGIGDYAPHYYIDVLKLLETYKTRVNPSVNFFTVQTAGYANMLIPEYIHRGAILSGWTGKEAIFADALIRQWDQIEAHKVPTKKTTRKTAKKISRKINIHK